MLLFPLIARLEAPSCSIKRASAEICKKCALNIRLGFIWIHFKEREKKGAFIYFIPSSVVLVSTADIVYLVKHHKLFSELRGGVRSGENIL